MLPSLATASHWVQAGAGPALVCRALERASPPTSLRRAHWALGSQRPRRRRRRVGARSRARSASMPARLVRVRQVHGAAVVVRARRRRRPRRAADADIIVSNDPRVGARDSDGRLRAAAHRRSTHGRGRGGACGLARPGGARAARRPSTRWRASSAAAPPISSPRSGRRSARAATKSARTCATRSRRGFPSDRSSGGSRTTAAVAPAIRRCRVSRRPRPATGSSTAGGRRAISSRRPACRAEQIFVAELCTASHPDVFCSYRRDGTARTQAGIARPPIEASSLRRVVHRARWRADRRARSSVAADVLEGDAADLVREQRAPSRAAAAGRRCFTL